ncbi:acyl carrier protein [Bordetella trematum]|uniref:acyl carrier protein n=1 Tax=Bordetella trematum TaxID=123899 RepID=UPI003D1092D5
MQTLPKEIVLPDEPELRQKLAEIIARVCRCEPEPLLEDQEFSAVVTQFDSLAVLEILLEVETEYGIQTDEMLPVDQEMGAQEITNIFPKNLSELIVYMHEVVARRPQREAEMRARLEKAQGRAATEPQAAQPEPAKDPVGSEAGTTEPKP